MPSPKIILGIMNINDFVMLPGSKTGTSMRLKAKTVRELQLEKLRLEAENKEMEKKLRQLQSNMSREKEERKKSSAYHWKSGQAGPMTIQARVLSQSKENNNKVSSGKVKLQILKEQMQEPVKEPFKRETANAVAREKSEVKGIACGLCEIKSGLLTEVDIHVGKLEAVNHFIKEVNLNELKINHEQKKVNSKHQVTSDKSSSLLASVGSAEELSSESTCTGLENQDKGLLLNGIFNEEESAKSFQEALIQWRKGNRDHREELHASKALSESVGICEVQTNLTVVKEPIHIEFKKDGLSYMEKLLLKKYRRTPVDQISGSCIKDLRPVQSPSVHQAVIGGEGEGDDDDVDDLTVEEVKRYWTSVFKEEVPSTISESAESSLKIEFLDDSYSKDLEESSNSLVKEAGAMGMNKQGKTEPLKQCGSGSAAADQNDTVPDLLPRETVGIMRKSSCHLTSIADTQYFLPFPLDRNPVSSKEISQGDGKWVTERSLSEYADDSVVQGVLESQLNRPSSGLETQNRICPLMVAWRSYPGNDSRRPGSTNTLHCKLTGNCPANTQPRPKSSPMHTLRVDTEIAKQKCLDVTKQDEYLWEYIADQEALLNLEKELQSYTGPEKHYSITSAEVTSSSRHSEKICGNTTDFPKNLELKVHSRVDTL
ncbi:hypothetical protein QYF61_003654, partial [Mycteria americana]